MASRGSESEAESGKQLLWWALVDEDLVLSLVRGGLLDVVGLRRVGRKVL